MMSSVLRELRLCHLHVCSMLLWDITFLTRNSELLQLHLLVPIAALCQASKKERFHIGGDCGRTYGMTLCCRVTLESKEHGFH